MSDVESNCSENEITLEEIAQEEPVKKVRKPLSEESIAKRKANLEKARAVRQQRALERKQFKAKVDAEHKLLKEQALKKAEAEYYAQKNGVPLRGGGDDESESYSDDESESEEYDIRPARRGAKKPVKKPAKKKPTKAELKEMARMDKIEAMLGQISLAQQNAMKPKAKPRVVKVIKKEVVKPSNGMAKSNILKLFDF